MATAIDAALPDENSSEIPQSTLGKKIKNKWKEKKKKRKIRGDLMMEDNLIPRHQNSGKCLEVLSWGRKEKVCICFTCPRVRLCKSQKKQIKIKRKKIRKREKNRKMGIAYAKVLLQGLLLPVLKLSKPTTCWQISFFSSSLSSKLIHSLFPGPLRGGAGGWLVIPLQGSVEGMFPRQPGPSLTQHLAVS